MDVNTAVDNFDAVIASHGSGLLARVGLPSVNHPTSRSKVKLIRRLAALGRPSIAHVPEVETSQCIISQCAGRDLEVVFGLETGLLRA
jgi:hypothetical protein